MLITIAYILLWLTVLAYLIQNRWPRHWMGFVPTAILAMCCATWIAALVDRGLVAGHWPLTTRFEVALFVTCLLLILNLLLDASWRETPNSVFVLAMALLTASYALTRPAADKAVSPLLPALRSVWLQIHVATTLVGYAAFAAAAGVALRRLAVGPPASESQRNPASASDSIAQAMERCVAIGFPWLTLGILTGAIWAQNAWGRYWGWDPKETWSLITWLFYLLIMHARSLQAWRGRRFAILVLIGFAVVVFTYIGVPWLVRTIRLESLHGFA